jgi:hypothetical protein
MTPPRRLVTMFLLGALLVLAVIPAVNLTRATAPVHLDGTLFNIDFALPVASRWLAGLGVSVAPRQAIVGKAGWLFLGDEYAQGISAKRRSAGPDDLAAAQRRALAEQAWQRWLQARGVRGFHVLVCADKDSIYPEFLPDWARAAPDAPIEALVQAADPRIAVDTRPALRAAHDLAGPPLYLRTDSHWTALGARVAYGALARAAATEDPTRAWLAPADVGAARAVDVPAGDLARLLSLQAAWRDEGAVLALDPARSQGRTQGDADDGRPLPASALLAVQAPLQPMRIASPQALNARRLLWLRDSFGTALLPYLAATYGDVVQVNRASTTPAQFAALVLRFKPDAVLVSVVERNARDVWFQAPPP